MSGYSYAVCPDEPASESLQRLASEGLGEALRRARSADTLHDRVHDLRKQVKRLRSLVRLYRPNFRQYAEVNVWLRDQARELSELRDAAALVETCEGFLDHLTAGDEGELRPVLENARATLVARRERWALELEGERRLQSVAGSFEEGRRAIGAWAVEGDGFEAVAPGLRKVRKRAHRAWARALDDPTTERLHEWRKRVKYHRHHLELLRSLWPAELEAQRDGAHQLSDRLGDDHDLAILGRVLTREGRHLGEGPARDLVLKRLEARREALQARAFVDAQRLFAEKPRRFVHRLGRYWRACQAEGALDRSGQERQGGAAALAS